MKIRTIKSMMDACYQAKRIREMLPTLPEGVSPSFIHYVDVIASLEKQGKRVRVSDISTALSLPKPGVTRTVKEIEKKGYLCKQISEEDARVTYLSMTEKGKHLSEKYNEQFFKRLQPYFEEISEEDAACTIRTVEKMYQIMSKRRMSIDE